MVTAGLFLAVFASGILLSRRGKPLNAVLSTIHKLVSLATFVWLVLGLYRAYRATALGGGGLAAGLVAVACFVFAGVSGGLLSTSRPLPASVLRLHQVTSVLTLLATVALLLLPVPG
jgi:hypothetical protein